MNEEKWGSGFHLSRLLIVGSRSQLRIGGHGTTLEKRQDAGRAFRDTAYYLNTNACCNAK